MLRRLVVVSSLLVPAVLLPHASEVSAASIVVTTTADTVASDGLTSLREAISQADASGGVDTITLSEATYALSLSCGSDEDSNAGGDLDIGSSDGLVIEGWSSSSLATITLDAGCTDERLIDVVTTGALTLRNLILDGGRAMDASTSDTDGDDGGAVLLRTGPLSAEYVTFSDNIAGDGGKADTDATLGGDGGAIFTAGSLTLTSCTFSSNAAGDGFLSGVSAQESYAGSGGAVYVSGSSSAVTITNTTFSNNTAGDGGDSSGSWGGSGGEGGALVFTGGAMTITDSSFTSNAAGAGGASGTASVRAGAIGGALALHAATLSGVTITGSNFTANAAGAAGLGVDGGGRGGNGGAIGIVPTSSVSLQVTVDTSTFASNVAGAASLVQTSSSATSQTGGSGGAIHAQGPDASLTVTDSTFLGNTAGQGTTYSSGPSSMSGGSGGKGGAVSLFASSATISGSTFQWNTAGAGGTGTSDNNGVGGDGGAIGAQNFGLDQPSLSVSASTFIGNSAGVGVRTGLDRSGDGGAIYVGTNFTTDVLLIDRSFFSENSAAGGENTSYGSGGGVYFAGLSSTATISNSTFEANEADDDGGAIESDYGASLAISFSTFSVHTASTGKAEILGLGINGSSSMSVAASVLVGASSGTGITCDTGVTSQGYNRELVSSDCTGWAGTDDQRGLAAGLLGAIDVHGGLVGETAIPAAALRDVIGPGVLLCSEAGADQRGVARVVGDGCDIGAVEAASTVDALDDSVFPGGLEPYYIGVTSNDTLTTSDPALVSEGSEITAVTTPTSGSASAGTSHITFTPAGYGTSTFQYTICNTTEPEVCDTATVTVTVNEPSYQMLYPVTPLRLFDTRPEKPQGEVSVTKAKVGGTRKLTVQVTGKGEIPSSGVAAVALNVTSTQQDGNGYVTVYPCTASVPGTSNLNFQPGVTVPNMVIAPVSADGKVCFYANTNTHLIADVSGWFAMEVGFAAMTPVRLFDTRPEKPQGEVSVTKSKVGPSRTLSVKVTGKGGVPSSEVSAVALNVTSTQQDGNGYVTVYPCSASVPEASNLNFQPGVSVPNMVIAPVSADGRVCFYANTNTHLIADVSGWFVEGAEFTPLDPARLVDTRPEKPQGEVTVSKRKVGGGYELEIKVTGKGGVPTSDVGAVSLNVTSTQQDANGYVTVYPCTDDVPDASNLNFRPGVTVPNAVIAPVSASGRVCFFASSNTHLIVDVAGWFTRYL